jgi:hypothetical protein
MSQLTGNGSQPGDWEELEIFCVGLGPRGFRLGTERFQEKGWQEPCESRDSRTDLWGTGGEIPPVYPASTLCSVIRPSAVW